MNGGAGPSRPGESRAWLQALFDESPLAIGFSRDGITLEANRAYVSLFGYQSVEELRGRPILEQIAPAHRARIRELVASRARGGETPHRYQTYGLRRDGTEFPFEITTTRVVVPDGPLTIAFIADVSEREAVLKALSASEERFRILSAAAFEGVFVHADGKIVLANEAGAAMFGFDPESMIGESLLDFASPETKERVANHVRRASTDAYDGVARRKDGTTFIAEVRGRTLLHQGRPTRVAIIRDITERRRAEAEQLALAERVRHAQKLESLGVLAGGVAHDFNNILTVIANGVALAKREGGPGAPGAAHLETIALAAERAADLCRQMLSYAGKAPFARVALDLSAVVGEMSSMLEVSIVKKAALVRDLAPGLPRVFADATQLRQIVMNLVLNASEAIQASEGTVSVSTGVATYGPGAFARSVAGGDPKPGTYVHLEVKDDGVGMDAATLAQMFDPFFTTKFMGRGLGMAAVLGIVRGHGGAIEVDSQLGKGTRVRVFLPATPGASPSAEPGPDVAAGGQGVVLVVDDERNVRVSTQLLLQELGFEVLVARDGVEALEVFRAQADRIDAVLLDLTMPRMDGMATLRELRRLPSRAPVVLTSGYGATPPDETGQGIAPDAVLGKPYTVDQLLEVLQRVMRAGPGQI